MKRRIAWIAAALCLTAALGSITPAGARRSKHGGRGDPAAGRQLFAQNCALCHGADGKGGSGPRLAGSSLSLATIQKQVTKGGTRMPSFGKRLSPTEVKAVSTYVRSLGAGS